MLKTTNPNVSLHDMRSFVTGLLIRMFQWNSSAYALYHSACRPTSLLSSECLLKVLTVYIRTLHCVTGHLCSAAIAAARCFHSRPVDTIIRPLLWDAFWKANGEPHSNGDQQFVDAVFRGLECVSKRVKGLFTQNTCIRQKRKFQTCQSLRTAQVQ